VILGVGHVLSNQPPSPGFTGFTTRGPSYAEFEFEFTVTGPVAVSTYDFELHGDSSRAVPCPPGHALVGTVTISGDPGTARLWLDGHVTDSASGEGTYPLVADC